MVKEFLATRRGWFFSTSVNAQHLDGFQSSLTKPTFSGDGKDCSVRHSLRLEVEPYSFPLYLPRQYTMLGESDVRGLL